MAHEATQIANAAARRAGARYSMNASAAGIVITSENCVPTASGSESPSKRIRRQFQSTTSRGAYKVCATAIAVKMVPNAPQAAAISRCVNPSALPPIIPGEKQ